MSFNPLSLTENNSPAEMIDLTLSISSEPSSQPIRAPRRCSCCRQTGHNARNCPHATAVQFRNQTFNMYESPRDNLIHFVYNYFIERVSGLDEISSLTQGLYDKIYFHVNGMTYRELKTALKNPIPTINYCHAELLFLIENYRILQISQHIVHTTTPLLGKHYAKKITIQLTPHNHDTNECFICCDKNCSVKTACGHEYCDECIMSILIENKNKTTPPLCSFCNTPFSKFIISDTFTFSLLNEFIQKLS